MTNLPTYFILGGGPAGLAAALALTDPTTQPGWAGKYRVEVIQMGWRVGGKGTTGRQGTPVKDPSGVWRIHGSAPVEEHGIHLFGNMYVNALRTLNTCYAELGVPGDPMDDLLRPSNTLQLADYYDRRWDLTPQYLPNNDDKPWAQLDFPGPETLILEIGRLMGKMINEYFGDGQTPVHHHLNGLHALLHRHGSAPSLHDPAHHGPLLTAFHDLWSAVAGIVDDDEHDAALRRSVMRQLEMYKVIAAGVVADQLFTVNSLDSVDHLNFIDWLTGHGMSPETVYSSAVQMPAQMCFQFVSGDTMLDPQFSAAGFLWFVLRQVLACGAGAYFFHHGTGDTVIAPMYEAAVARGVTFRFFEKVTDLTLSSDGSRVESIGVEVQATTVGGAPYDPLVTLDSGLRAWPNQPIFGQLNQGQQLQAQGIDLESWWNGWAGTPMVRKLAPGDRVVCAVPLPCIPLIAPALATRQPYAAALTAMPALATMAAQFWTNVESSDLLQTEGFSGSDRVCGGAAVPPLGFADMSDMLTSEQWPAGGPKGLFYVCGPFFHDGAWPAFTETDTPAHFEAVAESIFRQWMRTAVTIMPGAGGSAVIPESFDPALLYSKPGDHPVGEARFEPVYVRANIDPNELYIPSPPGSASARPHSGASGLTNMVLASDWIYTGINIGSFEGAVMSGMLASNALTGVPALDDIVGYSFGQVTGQGSGTVAPIVASPH